MGIALMFLLALYQMQSAIHSEIIEAPNYGDNALMETTQDTNNNNNENELLDALMDEKPEQTELEFRYPISAIGIDYAKNSVVLRFQKHARKQRYKYDPDYEMKRKSLQDNFMHFGKRQAEQLPQATGNGYYETVKRAAMDRYGRNPSQDFMRFGRAPSDFMRFGRAPSDFMRFGRDPKQDFMRFGRNPQQDFMRFGRPDNFMRFGRSMHSPEELRSPKQDFMRFGRPDNFMRFGRSTPTEFERAGKMDSNFMRFGKSVHGEEAGLSSSESNQTKATEGKQQPSDDSNPTDKAITMLFQNHHHQQQQQQQPQPQEEQQLKSSEQTDPQNNLDDSSVEQFYEP
ncbi:FMRFamide-related peptides [Drosophila innubila]|uniref:FMRFamide-related peptides n=1 Tax=Drosophila innubila TaxID=198719 RepID=UPI00148D6778|nr:FMRFamide-related peptides [Drosophila innubila]